jgi:hypothetical protein
MSQDLAERIVREMSLREPQADSVLKFLCLIEPVDLPATDQGRIKRLLESGTLQFPDEYARLTFALATGVGKSRLMGAMAAYLFLSGKSRHFVLLAPSSTIYRKMKAEAVLTHPKYLFRGLAGFPLPEVIHADNVETYRPDQPQLQDAPSLFILTPSQIRPRSGSEAERRLRRESETFGPSFVAHLAALDDLVVFLDEGHRYGRDERTTRAWAQAVADLKPKLVIEMTATPSAPPTVLYRYDLREALRDGRYIKNVVAIVEQRQAAITDEEWDKHTLREAIRRLEVKKNALAAFRENYPEKPQVKPVLLLSCRDTTHAAWAEKWLSSDDCNGGAYRGKVLRVDVTQSEDEIARLLEVESIASPIEIVINVGMLREGWDVTNVYVVAPLRAMVVETLATQTIGRGLRLPFGERVGVEEVDTLDVLCLGRETVQQVIEQAKAIGVTATQPVPGIGTMAFRQVAPGRRLIIDLPPVALHTPTPPTLAGWHPVRSVDLDLSRTGEIKRVETLTGKVEIIGDALTLETVKDWPKRLGQLLAQEVPELGGEELEGARVFREYLNSAGCDTLEKHRRAIQRYGDQIFQDVLQQVDALVQAAAARYVGQPGAGEAFEFREVTHSVPAQTPLVTLDQAQLPRDKSRLVSGWTRSLFPENKFDTSGELIAARILDSTVGVTWIRNPVRQFGITTQVGWHYPDFVVLTNGSIIFIEVKARDQLNDPKSDARKKAEAATEWCRVASATSGKSWEYWAVPDEEISACATLDDLKTHRHALPYA